MLAFCGLAGQRADHVVGLEAHRFQDGNAQRLQRAANVGNLPPQILGHRRAVGLVALVAHLVEALRLPVPLAQRTHGAGALVAKDLAAHIEDRGKVARRKVLAQLGDHVHKDVDGRRGQPAAGAHGPAALHCVVGAKDEPHGVEQEDGRLGWFGHGSEFIRDQAGGAVSELATIHSELAKMQPRTTGDRSNRDVESCDKTWNIPFMYGV